MSCPSSDPFVIRGPRGETISSLDDWLQYAPPKRADLHVKETRSYLELAEAWFRTGSAAVPSEVDALLASHERTAGFHAVEGVPELVTRLDDYRGEHRNHDLVVAGCVGESRVVMCVEAKADEAFGRKTIGSYHEAGIRNERSRVPDRIHALVVAIFGDAASASLASDTSRVAHLSYQLLAAVGGTLIEAGLREADTAVFLVHEFLHEPNEALGRIGTNPLSVERNRLVLGAFVAALSPTMGVLPRGDFLLGPFEAPGGGRIPFAAQLLIGKCSTILSEEAA